MVNADFKGNIDRVESGLGDAEIVHARGTGPRGKPLSDSPLHYDKGFSASGGVAGRAANGEGKHGNAKQAWRTPGAAAEQAAMYEFPPAIYGYDLGCGCQEAHLHAIGDRQGDTIEMDYMCDYGYHNFVVFRIGAYDRDAGLRLDHTLSQEVEEQEKKLLTLGDDNEAPRQLEEY